MWTVHVMVNSETTWARKNEADAVRWWCDMYYVVKEAWPSPLPNCETRQLVVGEVCSDGVQGGGSVDGDGLGCAAGATGRGGDGGGGDGIYDLA
jgi:hypothetical protein